MQFPKRCYNCYHGSHQRCTGFYLVKASCEECGQKLPKQRCGCAECMIKVAQ